MHVVGQEGGPRRELVLVGGLGAADVALVHREALRVLRSDIGAAHLDAYSDAAWPPAVLRSYERALALVREEVTRGTRSRRADPGMGIDIDVRDDRQFEVLSDLAPYAINVEGRRGDRLVFSAGDTGSSLWIAVTEEQEAELVSRLEALGIPPTVLVVKPRGRWEALAARVRVRGAAGRRPQGDRS